MTRFPRLWALLTGQQPKPARTARQIAADAYWNAIARSDTRAQHSAWEALRAATNRELRGSR